MPRTQAASDEEVAPALAAGSSASAVVEARRLAGREAGGQQPRVEAGARAQRRAGVGLAQGEAQLVAERGRRRPSTGRRAAASARVCSSTVKPSRAA